MWCYRVRCETYVLEVMSVCNIMPVFQCSRIRPVWNLISACQTWCLCPGFDVRVLGWNLCPTWYLCGRRDACVKVVQSEYQMWRLWAREESWELRDVNVSDVTLVYSVMSVRKERTVSDMWSQKGQCWDLYAMFCLYSKRDACLQCEACVQDVRSVCSYWGRCLMWCLCAMWSLLARCDACVQGETCVPDVMPVFWDETSVQQDVFVPDMMYVYNVTLQCKSKSVC